MSTEPLGDAIRRMGRLAGLQGALSLTDAQLLDRFILRRDEPAFAALMVRHGPMVLCLCRQILRDVQEAEDAFQASFMVLARNASAIRKRPSLSAWLYGVAYRVSARLRGRSERRRNLEHPSFDLATLPAVGEAHAFDLRSVLHEEIRRLPEKYRAPVVLCYLEGKTNEEAAKQLCLPVGTVKARLFRARELMRARLARRKMGDAAAVLTPARSTASVVPIFLIESTLRAAMRSGAGGLAKTVLAAMQVAKLKAGAAAVVALCLLGAGTTWFTALHPAGGPAAVNSGSSRTAAGEQAARPAAPDVVREEKKSDAGLEAHANDVCKTDAVRRLRDLVEQILIGSHKDKTPGLATEPRTERRHADELQAHPVPEAPAVPRTAPQNDMNGSNWCG